MGPNWAKREAFAVLVAGGGSYRSIAKRLGISRTTVHRWIEEPEVIAAVQKHRDKAVDRTTGALQKAGSSAAACLARLLKADSETVQLGAAKAILDSLAKFKDLLELQERVKVLEAQVGDQQTPRAA